ncbi:hypothetical protein pb186bvf_000874 [Paramecium bursaria]
MTLFLFQNTVFYQAIFSKKKIKPNLLKGDIKLWLLFHPDSQNFDDYQKKQNVLIIFCQGKNIFGIGIDSDYTPTSHSKFECITNQAFKMFFQDKYILWSKSSLQPCKLPSQEQFDYSQRFSEYYGVKNKSYSKFKKLDGDCLIESYFQNIVRNQSLLQTQTSLVNKFANPNSQFVFGSGSKTCSVNIFREEFVEPGLSADFRASWIVFMIELYLFLT